MIRLISRQNIEDFDLMVKGLERPLTKTSLGEYWTLSALYDAMVNQSIFGFYQEESQYSGAFSIVKTPLRKCMNIFWAGKDPDNDTPIDIDECDAFFNACAQHFECDVIMVKGRKGWGHWGGHLGYKEDSRVFTKEVTHELP